MACGRAPAPPPEDPALERLLSRPRAAAVSSTLAADVRHLSETIGPRPTGSAAFEEALRWTAGRLRDALGRDVEILRFPLPAGGQGANLVGTLPGGARGSEIVLVAAHLDSADGSPGALDAAAGVALVLDAARALAASRPGPPRSVRFALFGGEEQGMWGSSAYVRSEAGGLASHAAVLVLDAGAGPLRAFASGGNRPFGLSALGPLRSFRAPALGGIHSLDMAWGGCDALDFLRAGVPVLAPLPGGARYAAVRHTPTDVLLPQDEPLLPESAGIASALAWVLASADVPAASWRLDGKAYGRLLGNLADDIGKARERDAFLDAAIGPLPAPLLRTSSGAPPARRDARP